MTEGKDQATGRFLPGSEVQRIKQKYPASFTYLPHDFCEKRTDNLDLLEMGRGLYREPFQVLEPSPAALGINSKSTKLSTTIGFGEIYVIWATGTTLYKIGVSTDYRRRFKDLSASSPLPLATVKYAKCDNPHLLESHLHAMFAGQLFKNEWYSLGADDLATIEQVFDRYFEKPRPRQ